MPFCPNCGAEVAQADNFCTECGSSLRGQPPSGGQPHPPPQGGAGGQPDQAPQGGAGGQPVQRADQPEDGQPGPAGDQRVEDADEESPGRITRRQLLGGGSVVAVVVVGGAWAVLGGGDDQEQGPAITGGDDSGGGQANREEIRAVLDQFWQSFADGDADAYRAMFHSESPRRERSWWNDPTYWEEGFVQEGQRADWEVLNREMIDHSDTSAVVREVYRWTDPEFGGGDPYRVVDRFELRTEDGRWRIWEFQTQEAVPITPDST